MFIYAYSHKLGKESQFPVLLFFRLALTGPFLTQFWKPVLLKCSYGSWDHFMFLAKCGIWLGMCRSGWFSEGNC